MRSDMAALLDELIEVKKKRYSKRNREEQRTR